MINSRVKFLVRLLVLLAASLCFSQSATGIVALAPEEEQFVLAEDFFIGFALYGFDDAIEKFRLYIDKQDVTRLSVRTASTITYVPDQTFLARPDLAGPHIVTLVLYGAYNTRIAQKSVRFYIVRGQAPSEEQRRQLIEAGSELAAITPVEWYHTGRAAATFDYTTWRDSGAPAGELDGYGSGYRGDIVYDYNVTLRTDESEQQQTVQRFRAAAGWRHIARLSLGDNWPAYHPYLLNSQRLRGVEINLSTPRQGIGLDFAWGQAARPVSPFVSAQAGLDSLQAGDSATHNDSLAFMSQGTYGRRMLAARLRAGSGRVFRMGLTVVKARDDTGSIQQLYTRNVTIVPDTVTGDTATLESRSLAGQTPKDNIAFGADAELALLKRQLILFGAFGMSWVTEDISRGAMTQREIEDRFGVSAGIRPEHLAWLLIVNQTTRPLPIPADTTETINAASLIHAASWDAGVRLSTPIAGVRQTAEAKYFFAGPNFTSLGNEYFRADRAGWELSETVMLMDGRVHFRGVLTWFRNDLLELQGARARTVNLLLTGSIFVKPSWPALTVTFVAGDEQDTPMYDSLFVRDNEYNSLGATVQYAQTMAASVHTLSASFHSSRFAITSSRLAEDLRLSAGTVAIGLKSRFDDRPILTRCGGSFNAANSKGGLSITSGYGGLDWDILPQKLSASTDVGLKTTRNRDRNPTSAAMTREWNARAGWDFQMNSRNVFTGKLELRRQIGASYIDRSMRLSYEFRY
jgi:hypothetical protein